MLKMIEVGEVRKPKKPSKIAVYEGNIIVLEVHDEPRVDWTDEPTCLVREGKQKPFVHTQANVEAKSDPLLDDAGEKVFHEAML